MAALDTAPAASLAWAAAGAAARRKTMATLQRDGTTIYYEVHGSGYPVLFSHGYGSTAQMWRGQVPVFSKDFQFITWDMRGHGGTDSPDDPAQYSEAATVAD